MNDESTPKGAHETTGKKSNSILGQRNGLPLDWRGRNQRRRACNELNALLGKPTRPNLDVTCPRVILREAA